MGEIINNLQESYQLIVLTDKNNSFRIVDAKKYNYGEWTFDNSIKENW